MISKYITKNFLTHDAICDHSNPAIEKKTSDLCSRLTSTREKAKVIFNFVHDKVEFKFSPFADKASDTLKKNQGHCFQKSNLLVAMLRAAGILAGYRVHQISKDFFSPFVTEEGRSLIDEPAFHVYSSVMIDEKWINLDPTFDKKLSDYCFDGKSPTHKQWNGLDDILIPSVYLVGDQSEVFHTLITGEPLPDFSDKVLQVLNERLVEIRSQLSS